MDLSSFKKVFSGIAASAVMLTQMGTAFAAFSDVPRGVWYGDAVDAFVDAGYLDATQSRFRGGQNATRGEFVKLVVELNGGILSTPPAVPSFTDVPTSAWFYGYFEEAGKEGWVRGDGDCYGSLPCYARPGANVVRAEAAALIVRAFGLDWTGAAPQFVDNPAGQWYTDAVQTAADHCVLQGDDRSGRVRPGDNMNRSEMVVMLHRVDQGLAYGVDCGEMDSADEPEIMSAVAIDSTTVEVDFSSALDQRSAEDASSYSLRGGSSSVSVSSADLVGTSTVELRLSSALEANEDYTLTVSGLESAAGVEFSDSTSFEGHNDLPTGDGVLEVSLSASNPVGDTIPKGAVGVVMLSSDFTASCEDSIAVENLTILHEGFGDVLDIDGIYAAINGARVTRKRTIDAEDQTSDLRFASPLILDPCETVTVDIVADFNSTAETAAEHNLVVELPSDVFGNAEDVVGNFPVRGNGFRIAAVTSGIVTVDYRTVSPDEVEVGDVGVVVGKFEVQVDSVEDQTFYSMTLEQNSSASDGDFTNIAIRRTDGTILTNTVSQTVGDFITLVFDPPFTVLEGDKITLETIADIVGGAGDQIIMHFEETSDLFSVGSLYGYGVNGQLYGSQVSIPADDADTVSIDAGEFTIGIDGPATQDYTRDDNDAVLATITFSTGGEDIDIKDLFVAVQGQTSTGFYLCSGGAGGPNSSCGQAGSDDSIVEILEDVEIRNVATGRTIDGVRHSTLFGQSTTGSGTYQVYRFDDFIVRGDETWEFRVDFIDNGSGNHPVNGDKFKIHICGEPTHILDSDSNLIDNTTGCDFGGLITSTEDVQMQIEGLSTGDKVGDVRPRGNIAGNFHRIASATLTIAVKNIGTEDTAVENADDVNFFRFEARAGEAEDILMTKVILDAESGSLVDAQNYTLWVDTDGNGEVDTILEEGIAQQSSSITFADMIGGGYVIPKEETVVFEVHADVSSSLQQDELLLKFATGSSTQNSYIEAEELDDGSNLSGIDTGSSCQQDTDAAVETNCDIVVTTTRSQLWRLVSQGDLYVTKDSTPLRNRQLLGGSLGEAVLRMQFHAENESIDVTDIQINSSGGLATSVDRLELYREGEATPFALATVGGCGSDDTLGVNIGGGVTTTESFCANMENRQLVIPEGEDVDVLVRPLMKTDSQGGTSDETIQFFITEQAVSDEATGSGAIRARGDESSNNLIANNGGSTADGEIFIGLEAPAAANVKFSGNVNKSVLAKLTSITNASPDANGTAVPVGVSPIGQFKVSAAAHSNSKNGNNDVVLSGVVFNVNATHVIIDAASFDFYNKADSTKQQDCTVDVAGIGGVTSLASGSLVVTCQGLIASTVDTEIDQGTDATFVLEATVTNASAAASGAASSLQVSLQDFDNISRSAFGTGSVATESHIDWIDRDTGGSTRFTWVEYPDTTVKSTSYSS